MDGQLTPCVLGRFLIAGNVREMSLAEIFAGDRWREILATVLTQDACVTCSPGVERHGLAVLSGPAPGRLANG